MSKSPYRYASGRAPILMTSPGIALHTETECISSPSLAIDIRLVDRQNAMLRAYGDVYDRVLLMMPETGSGGNSEQDRVWYEAASETPGFDEPFLIAQFDVADAVAEIRSVLSLQVKELASVLGVERPTVYAWMRGDAKPQPQNRARLSELLKVAGIWKRLSDLPLGTVVRDELDTQGRSLLDDMRDDPLDFAKIESRMRQLHRQPRADDSLPKSILEIAKEHGIDTSRVRDNQDIVDVLSGKRTHED